MEIVKFFWIKMLLLRVINIDFRYMYKILNKNSLNYFFIDGGLF